MLQIAKITPSASIDYHFWYFYFGFWFLALEAAVIAPPGNDDLCGGNRAHLITAQICQRSPSFSALHKYHSCVSTNHCTCTTGGDLLDTSGLSGEVEWPSDMIMAANMVNGRQLMAHWPTEPFSSEGYFNIQIFTRPIWVVCSKFINGRQLMAHHPFHHTHRATLVSDTQLNLDLNIQIFTQPIWVVCNRSINGRQQNLQPPFSSQGYFRVFREDLDWPIRFSFGRCVPPYWLSVVCL